MGPETDSTISREDYARWITPSDAIGLLPQEWGRGAIIDAITVELETGGIRSVARRAVFDRGGQEVTILYGLIDQQFWSERSWTHGGEPIWVTAQLSIHQGMHPRWLIGNDQAAPWVRHFFTGVRFHPDDLALAFPRTESEAAEGDKSPLSDALLQEWKGLFDKAYPNGNEALGRQSVSGMFPDKSVTRERLRRIMDSRSRGRPQKNKG